MKKIIKNKKLTIDVFSNLIGNFLQGFIALLLVPIATRVLDASDYGEFGLGLSALNFLSAICEIGASFIIYAFVLKIGQKQKRILFATLIFMSGLLGVFIGLFLLIFWHLGGHKLDLFSYLSQVEIVLIAITIPMKAIWIVLVPILIVMKRSKWISISLVMQSLVMFAATVIGLYILEMGRVSLFFGNTAGNIAAVLVSLIFLKGAIVARPSLHWAKKTIAVAPTAWLTGIVENFRIILENSLLARYVGVYQLGNYTHSKLYQGMLMQGVNAFNNVLWPVALLEAKNKSDSFAKIKSGWNFVYFSITMCGLTFAMYGKEIIGLISNDKFIDAAAWVPYLAIYSLIQNAGKTSTAILFNANRGGTISKYRTGSLIVFLGILPIIIPQYGVNGLIFIAIIEMLITRVIFRIIAQNIQKNPFLDFPVILGCCLIILVDLIFNLWFIELEYKMLTFLLLMAGLVTVFSITNYREIKNFIFESNSN